MNYKKISELASATGIDPQDLFLIVDVAATQSKKCTLQVIKNAMSFTFDTDDITNVSSVPGATLTQALNNIESGGGGTVPPEMVDLVGRYAEGSSYVMNRDSEGFVGTIITDFGGGLTKTWTFSRDVNGIVQTINIHKSDNTYDKTYSFVRNPDGFVSSIAIS